MHVCALTDFGLHDYNQGLAGVTEYATELERIVLALRQRLSEARLIFLNTSVSDCRTHILSVPSSLPSCSRLTSTAAVFLPKSDTELLQPAHNTNNPQDNPTVIELNTRAKAIMQRHSIGVIDIYAAIIDQCGPVPFVDVGRKKCGLCAPHCKALTVHYTGAGYHFIAGHVAAALKTWQTARG